MEEVKNKKKSEATRLCSNRLCNKTFVYKTYKPKKYCNYDCAVKDPERKNLMRGKSMKIVLLEKYGTEIGLKKYEDFVKKQSASAKRYFQNKSKEERKKLRGRSGEQNGMYGVSIYDKWVDKYGKEQADLKMIQYSKKLSQKMRPQTLDFIAKMKLSKIKRVEEKIKAKATPIYNPNACLFIDNYAKENNYSFKHAENGGEFFVTDIGCFLDGYDEKRNTVIEYNERHHFDSIGFLLKKDLMREALIINKLKCDLIRVNEFRKNQIKVEILKYGDPEAVKLNEYLVDGDLKYKNMTLKVLDSKRSNNRVTMLMSRTLKYNIIGDFVYVEIKDGKIMLRNVTAPTKSNRKINNRRMFSFSQKGAKEYIGTWRVSFLDGWFCCYEKIEQ